MSYDIAFWNEDARCGFSPHAIYRRLRRGLEVKGLRRIPQRKAEQLIRKLLNPCEQKGEFFSGEIDGSFIEIRLTDHAILADFSLSDLHIPQVLSTAFLELGVSIYDPLAVRAPEGDHLYDQDYEEVSHDPDPGYWVELNLNHSTSHTFAN